MGKVIVVGSTNVDFIMKMDRLPQVGETVTHALFTQTYGGKGANQAIAAARAGVSTVFVTSLGDDIYTSRLIQNFKEANIDTQYIQIHKNQVCGTALVMVGNAGENYLSVAPGANMELKQDYLNQIQQVFQEASYVVLQMEIPKETNEWILSYCTTHSIPVILNAAPPDHMPDSWYSKIDYLIINETEAAYLLHVKQVDVENASEAASKLLLAGAKKVIITLGAAGCIVADQHKTFTVPSIPVKAVDTTAAGDTFCGAFAAARTKGMDEFQAITYATAAAAQSVTVMGAQPSIPDDNQTKKLLRSYEFDF